MKNFKELRIWQRSHQLVLAIYHSTKGFPKEETYGLTSQIRRSCTSIPTNIAEGCGRNSDTELCRFLVTAMGSASELEYQLLLCYELSYLSTTDYESLSKELVEIKKMINIFIQKLGK